MKVSIQMHGDQFNVQLSAAAGQDHFLAIKGCRIVQGKEGPFVSFPARLQDSGKWWNHVWASEGFQAAILKAHNEAAAKENKPAKAKAKAKPAATVETDDDDISF